MTQIITAELKSDLERLYKVSGDLLNKVESEFGSGSDGNDNAGKMLETIRFGLMDISGTLQKDIFNCDHIETQLRTNRRHD